MSTANLSADAAAHLALYDERTYGIALPPDIARELKDAGLVYWVPAPAWSSTTWAITPAGCEALRIMRSASCDEHAKREDAQSAAEACKAAGAATPKAALVQPFPLTSETSSG